MRDGRIDDAIKVAELNAEDHLDISHARAFLGDLYAKKGDRTRAIEAMKAALTVDPANDYAKKRLEALQKEEPVKP